MKKIINEKEFEKDNDKKIVDYLVKKIEKVCDNETLLNSYYDKHNSHPRNSSDSKTDINNGN